MASVNIMAGDLRWIRVAEEAESAACADFYNAASSDLGMSVQSIADATVFLAPRVPVSFFNRAIGFHAGMRFTETDLDSVIGAFEAARVPDFWVQMTPEAAPTVLPAWLAQRDFSLAPRAAWAKFVRGTGDPPLWPTKLETRVAAVSDASAIARIITDAYGLPSHLQPWLASLVGRPGWYFFVACADSTPIATGALHVRNETGWLGLAATDARHRGLGAQSALLALRIRAAADHGCRAVVTETGEPKASEPNPSLDNIRRAGFVQVCSRLNYRRPKG
jgi:hypothetical protein